VRRVAILEVNNLKKCFGSVEVLKDIGFSLEQGEAISVIGSSGSGKTTLLRCLNFLESPDAGQILVRGRVIFSAADPSTQKRAGDPTQAPALRPGVPEFQPVSPIYGAFQCQIGFRTAGPRAAGL
jgi:ABC-type histidine transport system ATPase subunit